jgi:hypothetical protein
MKKTIVHQLKTDPNSLCGMSYVVECADGSIAVIDGSVDSNVDDLYAYLRKLCGDKDPVVDAWFFTHAHPDHTYCAKAMGEKYADRMTVKKLIYRFPDEEFLRLREPDCLRQIPDFEQAVSSFGAEHVIPTRGDKFVFGDTVFEILLTCVDLPSLKEENIQVLNDTSMVFRLYAAGQSVLFLGDVQEAADRVMMKLYGKDLKSDVCQVAHHGYYASTARFYDLVDPDILFWPASVKVFETFSDCVSASRHLVSEMKIKDIYLMGHGTFSLELPIKARPEPFLPKLEPLPEIEAKKELEIPYTDAVPDINEPLGEGWKDCEYKEIKEKLFGGKIPCKAFYKAMWKEDKLYLNIRVDKKLIPRPDKISSMECDAVRICITDEAITDRNLTWKDVEEKAGNFSNLKIYPEEKNYKTGKIINVGGGDDCVSSYLIENERFYLTACIKMGSIHKKGDLIGFNLEITGLESNDASKTDSVILVSDTHGCNYWTPAALMFAELS